MAVTYLNTGSTNDDDEVRHNVTLKGKLEESSRYGEGELGRSDQPLYMVRTLL